MAAYFDQPELRRLRRFSRLGKSRITTKACTQLLLLLSILLNLPSYAAEKSSISENVVVTDEVAIIVQLIMSQAISRLPYQLLTTQLSMSQIAV